jgi:hypothetical protein
MKRTESFMGREIEIDPVAERKALQKKAESGEITGKAYWALLKATWRNMADDDKKEELMRLHIQDMPRTLQADAKAAAVKANLPLKDWVKVAIIEKLDRIEEK